MPLPHRLRSAALVVVSAIVFASVAAAHQPVEEMQRAARAFLAALSEAQEAKVVHRLADAERENWNFVPTARAGLPLKEMSAAQQELALALLRSGLSQRGFARAETIMALEEVLRELEGSPRRDPTRYFVTIFGTPADRQSWGWRFEGHHLSFNFTIVDGDHVFFTPSFLGANPAEVREGPRKGLRALGEEDDAARAFVQSLDAAQRKLAVIADRAPREIITGNDRRVSPLHPVGITAAALSAPQRDALLALVELYLGRWRPDLVASKLAELRAASADQLSFAWAGGLERGEGNYHRLQGPTFLIEFDNTQNDANHIHTTVRDFNGDFGHDALREHYARDPHP